MPSPFGHALGGIAAGGGAAPRPNLKAAIALTLLAVAPDLDLLLQTHRGPSHSVGVALIAGAVAFAITRQPRWGLAAALAWSSHIVLDWMSNDTRPPLGVMALWPLTHDYYKAGFEVFPAVSRRYWLAEFWVYNLKALAVELVILGPIAAAIVWWRRRA